MKQNPRPGDRRVRATLKTFKKNYRDEPLGVATGCRDVHGNIIGGRGFGVNLNERIKILLEENVKQRSVLKEKTYELEALTYKYRKIQNMVQSGQYLQVLTTAATSTSGTQLTTSENMQTNQPTPNPPLKSRSPIHGSFSKFKDDSNKLKTLNTLEHSQSVDINTARFGLRKSPLMSSATQITTTNTTSSTNNTTESTADYSSSKIISNDNATTSTNGACGASSSSTGQGKRALVAFDCPVKAGMLSASGVKRSHYTANITSTQTGTMRQPIIINYSKDNTCEEQTNEATLFDFSKQPAPKDPQLQNKLIAGGKPNNVTVKQSPKCTTDSSYCSMGADYELSESRKSAEELDLFTVFSYITGSNNSKDKHIYTKNEKRRGELGKDNFNRWSEGPFCTLMVRNNKDATAQAAMKGKTSRVLAPGKAVLQQDRASSRKGFVNDSLQRLADETRSSCPNIAETSGQTSNSATTDTKASRSLKSRRQSNQHSGDGRSKILTSNQKQQLPRTISMIEYLGMNEFDIIARRHDKLLASRQRKMDRKQQLACCYELSSCTCCTSTGSPTVYQRDVLIGGSSCHHTQSQADVGAYSSSDLLNSGADMLHSSSRLSCSTCCSFASQTYASQSDIYDTTESSGTVSTPTVSSSPSAGSIANNKYLTNSQASTRSSSINEQESQLQTTPRYCIHHSKLYEAKSLASAQHEHKYSYAHHHHHHHHSNEQVSTTSTNSSIMHNQQQVSATEPLQSTSNQPCCGPKSEENQINDAQIEQNSVKPLHSMDSENLAKNSTAKGTVDESEVENQQELENKQEQKLLIKCDVLESL